MKKYLIILSVLVFVSCNSKNAEELALEAEQEEMMKQRAIDSLEEVNMQMNQSYDNSSSGTTPSGATTTDAAGRKKMSNTTKGALIGTGAGIVTGAAAGAAVSKDKGKGAIVGGVVGGAIGSGVGYGIVANKDKKDTVK